MVSLTLSQYRKLRRIYLKTCRSYRLGSVWGPKDLDKLGEEQRRLVAVRAALR